MVDVQDLSRATVLIADDEYDVRRVYTAMLRRVGVRTVIQASDGAQALDVLGVERPHGDAAEVEGGRLAPRSIDLVISDIAMPRVTGLQVLETIRGGKTKAPASLPVIMTTGYLTDHTLQEIERLGAVAVLLKPVSASRLREEVRRALGAFDL